MLNAMSDMRELTGEALQRAVDRTAKQIVSDTRSAAPARTGMYRKGWSSKEMELSGRGVYGRTVHNRSRYQLAHLLQYGHGGPRPARAYPHIPSDEEAEETFVRNLESEMNRG